MAESALSRVARIVDLFSEGREVLLGFDQSPSSCG
jgi:hypothetical protein